MAENIGAPTDLVHWIMVERPNAVDAAEFYKTAFGAVEVSRSLPRIAGFGSDLYLIVHVKLKICGVTYIIADTVSEDPGTPKKIGLRSLVTENVHALIARAVSAGAVKEGHIVHCGGLTSGHIKDPYGYVWHITTPGGF